MSSFDAVVKVRTFMVHFIIKKLDGAILQVIRVPVFQDGLDELMTVLTTKTKRLTVTTHLWRENA